MADIIERLQDFGTRSLITHTLMAVSLAGAVIAGVFGGDEIARLSFVALLNFTAGLWICQSIHAIGNPGYKGIISVVRSDDK